MKIEKDEYGEDKIAIENADDLYTFLETIEQLQQRVVPIANALAELETGKNQGIDEEDITFEDGRIYAKYTVYYCGTYDDEQIHIPADYLFDPDFLEDAKERIRVRKEKERIEKEKKEAERKRRTEQAERKRYLELQEKYGDKSEKEI